MVFARYFIDRSDAGKQLATFLGDYAGQEGVLILALPRGGVPVAYEVATSLHVPMDIYIVRKLGVPGDEEYAFGAIAMDGTVVHNDQVSEDVLKKVMSDQWRELKRRNQAYRDNKPMPELSGKTIIIIDDGIATGATMKAAVVAIRKSNPKEIIVAVPVCPPLACLELEDIADKVVSMIKPPMLNSIGVYYQDFSQTTDDEVKRFISALKEK